MYDIVLEELEACIEADLANKNKILFSLRFGITLPASILPLSSAFAVVIGRMQLRLSISNKHCFFGVSLVPSPCFKSTCLQVNISALCAFVWLKYCIFSDGDMPIYGSLSETIWLSSYSFIQLFQL